MDGLNFLPANVWAGAAILFAFAIVLLWVATLLAIDLYHLAMAISQPDEDPDPPKPPEDPLPPRRRFHPQIAPVRPRVRISQSGDIFPLEDEILAVLQTPVCGAIRLKGGHGTGKTTALEHLAAKFATEPRFRALEDSDHRILRYFAKGHVVVYTTTFDEADDSRDLATYQLAPWDRDDLIEYLLSRPGGDCASVMARIETSHPLDYQGCPEIWRAILDTLAADPAIPNPRSALSHYLEWLQPDLDAFKATGRACLNRITVSSPEESPELYDPEEEFERLLRHRDVQILVAAEQLLEDLQKPAPPPEEFLSRYFPRKLIQETATLLREDVESLSRLLDFLDRPLKNYSLLVSLLHAADFEWLPQFSTNPILKFAYLEHVQWSGVELAVANLNHADFGKACLTLANLDQVDATHTNFRGATLTGSSMVAGVFRQADFSSANCSGVDARGALFPEAELEGVDFTGAKLRNVQFNSANLKNTILTNANLEGAVLRDLNLENAQLSRADLSLVTLQNAKLQNADFSDANFSGSDLAGLCFREACLDGANFQYARLDACDFEEIRCRNVNFDEADLSAALLTGSQMTNVSFQKAKLRGARLADISWEGVCLRNADLRGATFHMGSSRSGLLFTGLASEGTRTGFYTDEYEEQSFRAPEEIRKANLCGADLRGAKLSKVDFYLVDLRGAIYDPAQADHFRRCGAIL